MVGATIALQAATIGGLSDSVHSHSLSLSLSASGLIVGTVWARIQGDWTDVLTVARWWWFPLGAAARTSTLRTCPL
ncbi:hypothetical protein BH23ACT10_BH23ACT10_26660 [soil metagenome]